MTICVTAFIVLKYLFKANSGKLEKYQYTSIAIINTFLLSLELVRALGVKLSLMSSISPSSMISVKLAETAKELLN